MKKIDSQWALARLENIYKEKTISKLLWQIARGEEKKETLSVAAEAGWLPNPDDDLFLIDCMKLQLLPEEYFVGLLNKGLELSMEAEILLINTTKSKEITNYPLLFLIKLRKLSGVALDAYVGALNNLDATFRHLYDSIYTQKQLIRTLFPKVN